MNFGSAIEALKAGLNPRRSVWHASQRLTLTDDRRIWIVDGNHPSTEWPCSAFEDVTEALLATDWELYEE